MQVKIFTGPLESVEKQINDFLSKTNATVTNATQSMNTESGVNPIVTITIFYD